MKRRSGRACALFRSRPRSSRANGIVFRARDLLVRQRTQCVNALRGHLLEYDYLFPQGISHVADVVAAVVASQSCLPERAGASFCSCWSTPITALEALPLLPHAGKVSFVGAPCQGGAFRWVRGQTSLQPEATGAGMEETKCLKPSDSGPRIGDLRECAGRNVSER